MTPQPSRPPRSLAVRLSRALAATTMVVVPASLALAAPSSADTTPHAVVATPTTPGVQTSGTPSTPPIKHIWTIILENSDETATLASDTAADGGKGELTQTLAGQGADLVNYFGTGHASNDNYIAMTSGQGPRLASQGDCHDSSVVGDVGSVGGPTTTTFDDDGQALETAGQRNGSNTNGDDGCVFAPDVPSLANQLTNAGLTWKTYSQGMDLEPQSRRTSCAYNGAARNDPTGSAAVFPGTTTPIADNYAQKHDPFLYYQAVTGTTTTPTALCDADEVGLDHLLPDLASEATTPDYSLIIPDLCNDAHDSEESGSVPGGCKANSAGPDDTAPAKTNGVAQADEFLKYYVPSILGSPAFKDNGLLMITFDEGTEGLSCCNEVTSPNLPAGDDNGEPNEVPEYSTQYGVPIDQIPVGSTQSLRGGGQIGLVAISPFITPGTVSTVDYNHYSYLRTVEDLFHLTPANTKSAAFPNGILGSDCQGHLGYAGSQGATSRCTSTDAPTSFGSDVFTNPSGAAPTASLPEAHLVVLLPIAALLLMATALTRRTRRTARA